MRLPELSIRNPVFAWMLMLAIILFGLLGFNKLGVNENPDVDYPTVSVRYNYEGATPEVIEKDILEPVENVLVSMQGIRNLTSSANRGNGRITLEFDINRNIDFALQEVQTLIGRAQRFLPGVVEPPTVTKSNADDRPIMYLSLKTKTLNMREIMILFRDRIRDRLSTVDGVAEVRAFGFHEPMMRIDLLNEQLKKYDLTALDVLQSVKKGHLELAAGKFEKADSESLARFIGEATKTQEFKDLPITSRGGGPNYISIKIDDVAEVYEGIENLKRISRADKVFALGIAIVKQRGVNAVKTADSVIEKIKVINKSLPQDTDLSVNFNGTQFVKDSVNELIFTLLLSALLTSLVCWLFLKTFSATTNILLAIPTAVIGTFAFMNLFGFTLNTFSLLGITLAVGIVVDDAIVMLENIVRHREMGKGKINAAFVGSKEITFAVIATTLALIAIFAPITLMPGIEGKFFFEFAVTLCIAVSLSSLEALTLTPMRCSQFLSHKDKGLFIHQWVDNIIVKTRTFYLKTLQWSLEHKAIVLITSFIIFLSSLLLIRALPKEFAPAQDRNVLFLIFMAPDGKSLEYTDEKVRQFEEFATTQEGVQRVYVAVGGFGSGGQGNRGNGVVILKPKNERKQNQFEIAQQLREKSKKIKGIKVIVRDSFGSVIGGRRGSPVEFTIKGPSTQKQKEIFNQMKQEMEKTGKIIGIRSDDVNTLPEIHIKPKRAEAQKRGVDISQISNLVNVTLAGSTPGQYTDGGRRFDIFVQLKQKDREEPEKINSLFIRNNRGELINMKEVIEYVPTEGPQNIYRENRERGVRVDANLKKGVILSEAIKLISNIQKSIKLDGHSIEFSQNLEESLKSILLIILLGLVISYMVLGSQFNSFVDPIIVLLAVPFGVMGSLMALYIADQSINIYSMIGILLTMGIVKKNSILLVEFTNQLRDQGKQVKEALLIACPQRYRPIVMTTLSTLAAALPPALALGPGAETRIPMALVVIGGVSLSAFMTLYVVPCVYDLVARERFDIEQHLNS